MSSFGAGPSQGPRNDGPAKEEKYFSSVIFSAPQTSASQQTRRLDATATRGRTADFTPSAPTRRLGATTASGMSAAKSSASTPYDRDRRHEVRATPSKVPPPTVSIYDNRSAIVPYAADPPVARVDDTSFMGSPPSAGRMAEEGWGEPDEEQRRIARTVTVFGFTPDKVSIVLNFLDYCGKIEETWMSDTIANGMHVRFSTEVSAASAVAKNGQFVDGSLMIGVVKYDPHRFKGRSKAVLRSAQINGRANNAMMPLAAVRETYMVDATQPQTPYRIVDRISSAFDWLFGF